MKIKAYLLILLMLCGCSIKDNVGELKTMALDPALKENRFNVVLVQVFSDELAYRDLRGIYVIQDTVTGKEYIGVSGIGITETASHQAGKVRVADER